LYTEPSEYSYSDLFFGNNEKDSYYDRDNESLLGMLHFQELSHPTRDTQVEDELDHTFDVLNASFELKILNNNTVDDQDEEATNFTVIDEPATTLE